MYENENEASTKVLYDDGWSLTLPSGNFKFYKLEEAFIEGTASEMLLQYWNRSNFPSFKTMNYDEIPTVIVRKIIGFKINWYWIDYTIAIGSGEMFSFIKFN